ncbi:MAG: hypothetical protein N2C14_31805 [Planctomycetales bacterium]
MMILNVFGLLSVVALAAPMLRRVLLFATVRGLTLLQALKRAAMEFRNAVIGAGAKIMRGITKGLRSFAAFCHGARRVSDHASPGGADRDGDDAQGPLGVQDGVRRPMDFGRHGPRDAPCLRRAHEMDNAVLA